jgi:hypothetical protein
VPSAGSDDDPLHFEHARQAWNLPRQHGREYACVLQPNTQDVKQKVHYPKLIPEL